MDTSRQFMKNSLISVHTMAILSSMKDRSAGFRSVNGGFFFMWE